MLRVAAMEAVSPCKYKSEIVEYQTAIHAMRSTGGERPVILCPAIMTKTLRNVQALDEFDASSTFMRTVHTLGTKGKHMLSVFLPL